MSALRLAAKDLALEARTRELLDAALLGGLGLAVAAGASLAPLPDGPARAAAVVWVGVLGASMVPLARSFTGEADRGTLEVLLLLPVERGSILMGKVLSNLALALAGAAAAALAYALLFAGAPLAWGGLVPVLALGALGVSAAGSMSAALAAQARGREALLPVLLLPLLLPVLLGAVPASLHALAGDPLATYAGELQLLAGYDLVLLALGWWLFGAVAEDAA